MNTSAAPATSTTAPNADAPLDKTLLPVKLIPEQRETIINHCLWSIDPAVMTRHLSNPGDEFKIHLVGYRVGSSSACADITIKMPKAEAIRVVQNQNRKQRRIAEDDYEKILRPIFVYAPIATMSVGYSSAVSTEQQAAERAMAPNTPNVTVCSQRLT
jgi:hypothetical protein